jgi:hypothetical protein
MFYLPHFYRQWLTDEGITLLHQPRKAINATKHSLQKHTDDAAKHCFQAHTDEDLLSARYRRLATAANNVLKETRKIAEYGERYRENFIGAVPAVIDPMVRRIVASSKFSNGDKVENGVLISRRLLSNLS